MATEIIQPQPTSETPLTIEGYPYGFRLRTKAQYWIDTVNGKGQRIAFRTLNPKTQQWNKPKLSVYSDVLVLVRNLENGHIENDGLSFAYGQQKDLDEFLSKFPESVLSEWQKRQLAIFRAIIKTRSHISVRLVTNPSDEETKRIEENNKKTDEEMHKVFISYLAQETQPKREA